MSNSHTFSLSRQSQETQNVTLSISSFPLCKSPSITSLSPTDLQGPLTGPCYPGTREMQIDSISAMAFLKPLQVTETVISGKDMKIRGKCQTADMWIVLFTLITGSWNKILVNATLLVYNSRGLYYAVQGWMVFPHQNIRQIVLTISLWTRF